MANARNAEIKAELATNPPWVVLERRLRQIDYAQMFGDPTNEAQASRLQTVQREAKLVSRFMQRQARRGA